jgi:Icc protein
MTTIVNFEKIFADVAADGVLRLLQITDTHLFADRGAGLLGVNTFDSFRAVVRQIKQDTPSFDWILATGDISQDHSIQSYQRFADEIKTLDRPCLWLPGNHDMQQTMKPTLADAGISSAKHLVSEHWHLILLDTQVETQPHGQLSEAQLKGLKTALDEYPDKFCLICMHHQSVPVGCLWLDQHHLKNSDVLHELLQDYPNVKGIVFGHVHQNYEFQRHGLAYIASPSTCIQFLPLSHKFALDHQQPGYRYLKLTPQGDIVTRVRRLAERSFLPDPQSKGY